MLSENYKAALNHQVRRFTYCLGKLATTSDHTINSFMLGRIMKTLEFTVFVLFLVFSFSNNASSIQKNSGDLEFLQASVNETIGPIGAAKYFQSPSYTFEMTAIAGKFKGQVRVNSESIYYETEFTEFKDGKYVDHVVPIAVFMTSDSKATYKPEKCEVGVSRYTVSPDRLRTDYFLEGFLPSSWMMMDSGGGPFACFMASKQWKEFDKVIESVDGKLNLRYTNVTNTKSYHLKLIFSQPIPFLESAHGTDDQGRITKTISDSKWETIEGKTLLVKRVTEGGNQFVFQASRVDDDQWGYGSIDEFKSSLPSGTRWQEFGSDSKVTSTLYLGDDPAKAKSDYERQLQIRNAMRGND